MTPSDFYVAAQMAKLRVAELADEAKSATAAKDEDRLKVIGDEMEVIASNLREIRRQQLLGELPQPQRRRSSFWRGLLDGLRFGR